MVSSYPVGRPPQGGRTRGAAKRAWHGLADGAYESSAARVEGDGHRAAACTEGGREP